MNLTHTEALTRYCPLTNSKCGGQICMAWRVTNFAAPNRYPLPNVHADTEPALRPGAVPASWHFVSYEDSDGVGAHYAEPIGEAAQRNRGGCGMVPPLPLSTIRLDTDR